MAQYRIPHPYDARFALPANVMSEPPGRGTLTTNQRPRRTFDSPGYIPAAWNPGFDIPQYIKQEPLGRGTTTTYQARRKTISQYIPPALGCLESDTLGANAMGLWPFDKIASAVKKASVTIYKGGKKITYDLPKHVHCKLASSQVGTMGAGAIAKYYGVPPDAGMAAHQAVNLKICGEKYYPKPPKAPPPKPSYAAPTPYRPSIMQSKWVVPAAVGAAGLLAVYLITRK